MYTPTEVYFPFLLALTLGIRHGIDWDHIAAISDISGTTENTRQGILLGGLYIIGHASVIIILGLVAVLVGIHLPEWVDSVMGRLVGVTLLILGLYLFSSILIHGKNFRMKSSRILLLQLCAKVINSIHDKIPHKHKHKKIIYPETVGKKLAFSIGILHGIGAETPTQVLLFVTAAGVGKGLLGSLLVLTFVLGLMLSNTIISLFYLKGFLKTKENSTLRLTLGFATAVFSFIVGLLFLFQKESLLPVILGG